MKKIFILVLGVILMAAAGKTKAQAGTFVTLDTNYGKIQLELYPDKAPVTVKNFIAYVEAGYYNNLIFHRVIPGFMIQGGGFTVDMVQKPTNPPIINEAANGLKNERGTIAMARTNDPDSATAQFFINVVDNSFLDYKNDSPQGIGYTVFGKVVGGMDVVDKIAKVKTHTARGHRDVPEQNVIIRSATISFKQDKKEKKDKKTQ
jgi:cyclophilin family peptidyl-prolyl cis-trans isomerase